MFTWPFSFPFVLLLFLVGFLFLSLLLCVCHSFLSFVTSLATMAHSSAHARTVPERSRSRDDHMWQRPQPQQRGRSYDPRPEAPPAPRLRKVLVIVDLLAVRPLMTKVHSDVMQATTCEVTPSLNWMEERALFTYNVLLNTHRLENPSQCTTFFIASASTSGTRGITTCLHPPWTSDGRMKPAIHSLVETNFDLLTFYMTFDLTGSKVKTVACFFELIPAHLGLTWSLSSCAWVAMRPCPIATCFLKLEKFLALGFLGSFFSLLLCLFLTC